MAAKKLICFTQYESPAIFSVEQSSSGKPLSGFSSVTNPLLLKVNRFKENFEIEIKAASRGAVPGGTIQFNSLNKKLKVHVNLDAEVAIIAESNMKTMFRFMDLWAARCFARHVQACIDDVALFDGAAGGAGDFVHDDVSMRAEDEESAFEDGNDASTEEGEEGNAEAETSTNDAGHTSDIDNQFEANSE